MAEKCAAVPRVLVVPVYVEISAGFERAIGTLESILQRAGYRFHTGDPLFESLDDIKQTRVERTRSEPNNGEVRTGVSA